MATIKADTARDLAEAALQGRYRIGEFIAAARQLEGVMPPPAGSREELVAGFALMRKTWRCVHDQLSWPVTDIDTFGEMVDTKRAVASASEWPTSLSTFGASWMNTSS